MDSVALGRHLSESCGGYWLRDIPRLRAAAASAPTPLTIDDIPELLDTSRTHAVRNELGRAANWLVLSLICDEPTSLRWLAREGYLRSSKYRFNSAVPLSLVEQVVASGAASRPRTRELLESTEHLLRFSRRAGKDFETLIAQVRREPTTFARSCLITIDLLFMIESYPDLPFDMAWQRDPFTKEELAEGFSFLWSHVHGELGITRVTAGMWDTDGIYRGRYLEVLKRAAGLRELAQAEVLLETFGYRCRLSKGNAFIATVSDPGETIERTIRLGFVDAQMRHTRLVAEARELEALTLRRLGEQAHRALSRNGLIQELEGPPHRVRFLFPALPTVRETIRSVKFFREELPDSMTILEDYGLTPTEADAYMLGKALSLGGVRRVQRLAHMISTCVAIELSRVRDQHDVVVNSASPVYQGDEALDAFLATALDADACAEFRNLFRWPPFGTNTPSGLDVQYRPMLEAEHEWHIPMTTLAHSNLTRAALVLTGLRPGTDPDLIASQLVDEFCTAGFSAHAGIKIRDQQ